MKVQHMVCPRCSRLHGRDHATVCPDVYEGDDRAAYLDGWVNGSAYIAAACRAELDRQHQRADEAEARVLAKLPQLLERIQKEAG